MHTYEVTERGHKPGLTVEESVGYLVTGIGLMLLLLMTVLGMASMPPAETSGSQRITSDPQIESRDGQPLQDPVDINVPLR